VEALCDVVGTAKSWGRTGGKGRGGRGDYEGEGKERVSDTHTLTHTNTHTYAHTCTPTHPPTHTHAHARTHTHTRTLTHNGWEYSAGDTNTIAAKETYIHEKRSTLMKRDLQI